ncbi:unnamed protein product [Paramecium primaurelia]|uniref:Uncharacterized protein n=1 Tax=Paramecium primaurelia TaxID=5886 RepID=A0A8S1N5N4_PARPR|nr:unnamed protein product [Paramecium primaurelia]
MGIICSKQHPQQATQVVQNQHDFQNLLDQKQINSLEPEEENKDQKYTKIDVAQNSIDLNKKRYSSRDMSIISKYIENELKNQSVKLERLTIDMRDPSMSVKGGTIVQRKEISQDLFEEDDSHICYTIYTNPKYKRLKSINEHTMVLLHLNENKEYLDLLYRVTNDYHFTIEHQDEFKDILTRSQDSFLQNLLISEKYINEYGIFHIIREAIKCSKLELILQNDYTLNSTQLHYNKLFVDISLFPIILATQHIQIFCLEFTQQIIQYKKLTNSNQDLIKFLNEIKQTLGNDIQFLSISQQNQNMVLSLIINNMQSNRSVIISNFNTILNGKFGFITCKTQPLIKYVGCELSDIDAWNNREFKEETRADSQYSLQYGWKLFGLNFKQYNISNIGFIYYNPNQMYYQNIRIYSLSDINKYSSQFELIDIKVYCEKKQYKILFQVTYQDDDLIIIDNMAYLNTLMNSRLTGILVYDAEKYMKY